MSAGHPWMKFYPRDWRGEQALRAVSIGARGLWIECICIMHEAKPYGHLLLNGVPVGDATLANMTGVPVDEVSALMAELRKAGVFSVTRKGVVFSRRMVGDQARSNKGRESVNRRYAQDSDFLEENDAPNRSPNREPTTQKPDTRKTEIEKETPNGVSKNPTAGSRLPADWEPSSQDFDFAASTGMSHDAIFREADRFRDYWIGQAGAKGRKADWPATWRNWIRRANEDRGQRRATPDNDARSNHLAGLAAAVAAARG